MHADLTDLRLFLRVVEAGSITAGAARAGLSLAAASERIRAMEAGGVALLDRGRRGVQPTAAGHALVHHARKILRGVEEMREELGRHAAGVRTTVRLDANTAAIVEFLPAPLGAWLAAHPRVDVELRERQSVDIVKAVAHGHAELGVVSDAVDTAGLALTPFATDRLAAIAPPGTWPGRTVRLAEVAAAPLIGIAGGALHDDVLARADRMGLALHARCHVRTYDALCRMVAAGAGVGILPLATAQRFRRGLALQVVRLAEPWASRTLSLCVRPDGVSPLVEDLRQSLALSPRR